MPEMEQRPLKKEIPKDETVNLCPFLGYIDDPETAISYPSRMNCCYHVRPVMPISVDYQRQMCLTGKFSECAVYQREKLSPLPVSLQETSGAWEKLKPVIPIIALILVLIVVLFAGIWMGILKIPDLGIIPGLKPTEIRSEVIISPTATGMEVSTAQSTPSEQIEPTASETSFTPTSIDPHLLETLIGDSPPLVIHKVLEGEGYIWLAQNYNTSEEAIKAINYNLPESLWVNTILVIPVNTSDIAQLPKFSAYMIEGEKISIEKMAELLNLDVDLLKKYNDLPAGYELVPGEWLLIPH